MIARIWRGSTRVDKADEYLEYLTGTGIGEYLKTSGSLEVMVLRRPGEGGTAEFVLLSLWESPEAVRRFAGDDPEQAVFYPRDEEFLVDRDLTVDHFEVVLRRASVPE